MENTQIQNQSMAQPINNVPEVHNHKKSSGLKTLVLILVVIVMIISAAAAGFLIANLVTSNNSDNKTITEDKREEVKTLTITAPKNNGTVNGVVELSGKASSSLQGLKFEIKDGQGNSLGTSTMNISTEEWNTKLLLTKAPITKSGTITITPTLDSDLDLTKIIIVNFAQVGLISRLNITAPLLYQSIKEGDTLLFKGEMKGFYEGILNVRLSDSNENIILEDVINAEGDNYEGFVPFEKSIEIKDLSKARDAQATILFYEISAKDGKEIELYSMPVLLTIDD
jgi:hypothetical protein